MNLASWLGRVFVPTESLFLPEALTLRFLFLAGLASHFFGTLKWYRIHDGSIKNIGTPPAFSKGDQSQVPAEAATHRKIHQPFIALMNQTMQSPRKLHPVFFIISFTCLAILYFALPVVFSRSNWFPETEAFSMIPTITICALFWMIMNLIVQYLVLSASTIFTSDIREEKTGLLTIHGVSPAKMWLSRILVNGIHALITLCAAFVVLLPIVFPEIFRWGENNYYTFFLGSSTQSYLLSIPAKAYILGTAAFIMQLYCSGAVATATFRSRIISWMAIMILTAVPIMFLFVLDPVPWEAVPFAAILLWSIMLVVSFRNFTRHMRKRKISLTSPVFMAFIIVPWLLYFWFLPWISAWSIHREPAFFVPDEKIMNDPYNPSFGEDKIALQLERDTLPWARNANTFEALDAWGVSKNNVLDTKGPWGIPKEISLSSNNFAHDIANNLESSWRNHIRLWNENRRACCGYSTNFEARLLVNMYFFCEYFSDVDLEMLINLLHRIPDERPPIKEQAKRIWQLAVRASRVQDSHLQYPLAPLFYTDQNAVRLQFERWLWNQNQAVAEWGTLQEQYYLKGNRLADPTKKLKQLRKRITLWSNRLKRITDLPLPCVVFSSKGEHLHSIVSVENLRRTLLIQLAILRYYYRHNDFPPQLNSLVDEGFLQKVPEPIQIDPGPGKHIPFYYSQKNTSATKNSEREESQSHCQQFSSGSDFDGKVTNEKEPKISQYTLLITTENGTAFCDSTPNRSVFTEVPNELAILHWILSGGAPLKIVSQNPILYNPHTGEFLDLKKPNHKMEIKCNSH
ncbi:MAG: hypothetical protein Q4G68_01185 [Planctomycetia bacterium]|nr:hypothetical protein [Planctomycetia bacterium]